MELLFNVPVRICLPMNTNRSLGRRVTVGEHQLGWVDFPVVGFESQQSQDVQLWVLNRPPFRSANDTLGNITIKMVLPFGRGNDESSEETTQGITLGSPEAEAELTNSSPIYLGEVFSDYLSVLPQLEQEKFIVSGRKGSGKTAIAESIRYEADKSPNTFCRMIKNKDFDKESTVQEVSDEEGEIQKQLFEWLILTNLLSMITENVALEDYEAMDQLRRFLNKNRGHIEIDNFEVDEVFEEESYKIDITYLKRAFQASFGDRVGISAQKAPFYKISEDLRRVITDLLKEEAKSIRDNKYILIFDDLDIGFDSSSEKDINLLLSLIRKAREYNNEVFGKSPIKAKVIVLIRRDIEKLLKSHAADSAKIFSTYGVNLKWYEHIKFEGHEDKTMLMKFIEDRIRYAFDKHEKDYDKDNPWKSLVKPNASKYEYESGFKFIIDHTFYRPRDLILFFQPIRTQSWELPLSYKRVNKLTVKYADELVNEVKNELNLFYSGQQMSYIFEELRSINAIYDAGYNDAKKAFNDSKFDGNIDNLLEVLFDYSIIGNVNENGEVRVKHRERDHERYQLERDQNILLTYPIKTHLERTPQA